MQTVTHRSPFTSAHIHQRVHRHTLLLSVSLTCPPSHMLFLFHLHVHAFFSLSVSPTHTHSVLPTHTLFLSHNNIYTFLSYPYILSLPFFLPLADRISSSLSHPQSLSLFLSSMHTLSLTHIYTHSLSHPHIHSLSLSPTHTFSLSPTHTFSHPHIHSFSPTLSLTYTLTLSPTHTLSLSCTHTHSLSHSPIYIQTDTPNLYLPKWTLPVRPCLQWQGTWPAFPHPCASSRAEHRSPSALWWARWVPLESTQPAAGPACDAAADAWCAPPPERLQATWCLPSASSPPRLSHSSVYLCINFV